jgi:hypothetical protein
MTTKYIVNGPTGPIITGPINGVGTYKALLSQTGTITGTDISNFYGEFIVGETYTIDTYVMGDDFSNVANVQSGDINTSGCVFTATGPLPTVWTNGSTIISDGTEVVANVIENSLPFSIVWLNAPFGGGGYYIGFNSNGPIGDTFPRNQTSIKLQNSYPFNWEGPAAVPLLTPGVGSMGAPDEFIYIDTWNTYGDAPYNNALYFTPIEINIKY